MKRQNQTDQIEEYYESLSRNAIRIGGGWVNMMVERYQEPSRAGTPKGQLIGLSSKKYRAALFMILYDGRNLKEIASLAQVSPGLLRLWRTEPAFQETSRSACGLFAAHLVTTMDFWIYDHAKKIGDKATEELLAKYTKEGKGLHLTFKDFPYKYDPKDQYSMIGSLVDLIPFFNVRVHAVIQLWLEKRLKEGCIFHSILTFRMAAGRPKNIKMLRKWEIKRLDFTKTILEAHLHLLAASKETSKEKKQTVTLIRDFVFKIFDNLAGA